MNKPFQYVRAVMLSGLAATACVSIAAAHEEKPTTPGERAVAYRMALFTVMGGNFGPINQMATGKMPFDQADVVRRAERVAFLAKMVPDAFPAASNGVWNTSAKPDIWTKPDDFSKAAQALIDASAALWDAAKTGDQAKIKTAAQQAAGSCKSCHDKFKAD